MTIGLTAVELQSVPNVLFTHVERLGGTKIWEG